MSGWRKAVLVIASAFFITPQFILTVFFQGEQAWINGTFGFVAVGMGFAMACSVLGLPMIPFAIKRKKDGGTRLLLIGIAGCMLFASFSNSLDALNKIHSITTGDAKQKMHLSADLKAQIKDLKARRADIPKHDYASVESVELAKQKVSAAKQTRDAECGTGYDKLCRGRETELAKAEAELTALQNNRVLTEKAEKVQGDLDKAQGELRALGWVPDHADLTAVQLAKILSVVWSASEDGVSDNRPIFTAFVIELMGGMMPWVLFSVFGPQPDEKAEFNHNVHELYKHAARNIELTTPCATQFSRDDTLRFEPDQDPAKVLGLQDDKPATLSKEPATPAELVAAAILEADPAKDTPRAAPKKPRGKKKPASPDSVWAWHKAQVLDRPGRKERCKPVYDNYVEWCEDNNLEALTFPKFSAVLKDEIGVKKQDTHNRHFYLDIGIRPKLRVVGAAQAASA